MSDHLYMGEVAPYVACVLQIPAVVVLARRVDPQRASLSAIWAWALSLSMIASFCAFVVSWVVSSSAFAQSDFPPEVCVGFALCASILVSSALPDVARFIRRKSSGWVVFLALWCWAVLPAVPIVILRLNSSDDSWRRLLLQVGPPTAITLSICNGLGLVVLGWIGLRATLGRHD